MRGFVIQTVPTFDFIIVHVIKFMSHRDLFAGLKIEFKFIHDNLIETERENTSHGNDLEKTALSNENNKAFKKIYRKSEKQYSNATREASNERSSPTDRRLSIFYIYSNELFCPRYEPIPRYFA